MTTYTDDFIERAFMAWYSSDRSMGERFKSFMQDEGDNVPGYNTIKEWAIKYGWHERADALDAQITQKNDEQLISVRAKMFEKQTEYANTLIAKGMEYLEENGITSDNAAIRAIDLGLATQRTATGMAEAYFKISQMGNDQLTNELKKLLGTKTDEETVEAEVSEE